MTELEQAEAVREYFLNKVTEYWLGSVEADGEDN